MQRYFVKNEQINDNNVIINGQDYHHIKNVMRMKIGDKVYVVNQNEKLFICKIELFNSDSVLLNILENVEANVELPCNVTIAYGLVRREKNEEVVKHITELGASGFISVEMKRSVVRLKDYSNNKIDRLRMISKEASEQCHRLRLMKIYDTVKFKEFLDFSKQFDVCLYAYEESGRENNYSFKRYIRQGLNNCLILVGPEGGFDPSEVELLDKSGFKAIGLGPRILRSETAPLYIMSSISYELEIKYED